MTVKEVEAFFKNPNALECQVWDLTIARHFERKGYTVTESNDGSWWICDESRFFD